MLSDLAKKQARECISLPPGEVPTSTSTESTTTKICKVCKQVGKAVYSRGMCQNCYRKWQRATKQGTVDLEGIKKRANITDQMLWSMPLVQLCLIDTIPVPLLSVIVKERIERDRVGTTQDILEVNVKEKEMMLNFISLRGEMDDYLTYASENSAHDL